VNAQVGLLLALHGQDPDQHDQLFGILERPPALAVSFDRRKTGRVEELEKVLTGLVDPLGRNLAGGAGRGHAALLSAKDGAILPQRTPLANSATPQLCRQSSLTSIDSVKIHGG
jgi:hypothetical protein